VTADAPSRGLSLLTIDVGSVNTRAHLFDAVEGRYRLLASSNTLSTIGTPAYDLNLGVLESIKQLEAITGKTLLSDRGLMVSSDPDDPIGANAFAATFSGGPSLKVVTVGLLDAVSLKTINNLVGSGYCKLIESFSLNDRRNPEAIVDAICQKLPDLLVIGGGTNRGASRSVLRLANTLAMAISLIPEGERPEVFYAGNENLQEEIDNLFGAIGRLHFASNVRPTLKTESLGPATKELSKIYFDIQSRKLGGLKQLCDLSGEQLYLNSQAFGRLVRFLSTVVEQPKGTLGVDLGASSTTVASGFAGHLNLRVYTGLGIGRGLKGMVEDTVLQQITRWLPYDLPDERVLDYLYNKPLIPQSLPSTEEDLAIEQAAARQVVRMAIRNSMNIFDRKAIYPQAGGLPWFDRIIVSGSTLARAPRAEDSLLMILDSIQPVGITTIILDPYNLAAAIGASAEIDPMLAIQVLESNSFTNLGTVISTSGAGRPGNAILRVQIQKGDRKEDVIEIKAGELTAIPIGNGGVADIFVQPLQNANIGLGAGRGGWIRRVVGGLFGLVLDGRGRPIQIPTSFEKRRETLAKWQNALARR
jgi:hypothetical protein